MIRIAFTTDTLPVSVRVLRLALGVLLLGIAVAVPSRTAATWIVGFVCTCGALALFITASVGQDVRISMKVGTHTQESEIEDPESPCCEEGHLIDSDSGIAVYECSDCGSLYCHDLIPVRHPIPQEDDL